MQKNDKKETRSLLSTEVSLSDDELFHILVSHSNDVIQLVSPQGKILYSSDSVTRVIGYKPAEIQGVTIQPYIHPDDWKSFDKKWKDLMQDPGGRLTVEYRVKHKNDEWVWIETKFTNHLNNPNIKAILGNFRSITKRKKAEEALHAQTQLMEVITGNAISGLLMMNAERFCIFMNPAAEKIIGMNLSELQSLRKSLHDAIHHTKPDGSTYPLEECPIDRALINKKQFKGEDTFIRPNGTFYPVAFSASPIIKDDSLVGTVVEIRDITQEKSAQQELAESEKKYRQLADLSPDAIVVHAKGKFLYINPAGAKLLGAKSPKQLIGKPLITFVHPDYLEQVKERIQYVMTKGKPTQLVEEKFIRLDGSVIDAEVISLPFNYQGEAAIQVVGRDITQRKQAEAALIESEHRWRFLAESLPQKIFTAKPDGEIEYFNHQWIEFSGCKKQQAGPLDWTNLIHPDDVRDNMRIWKESITTGKPFALEHRLKQHDDKYRWHITRASAMRNEEGAITKWFGSSTDIHDIKMSLYREHKLEIKTLSLTKQREKLVALNESKDEFISLASHQLRTPATVVKQYLGMVLEGYAGDLTDAQKEMIIRAYDSNNHQIDIVNDLLRVARLDAGKVKLIKAKTDLVDLIEEVMSDQQSAIEERHQKIEFIHKQKTTTAEVDRVKTRMVLENLIDNASKYTPEEKKISILLKKDKKEISIAIQDEGVGIAPEDIDKLFRKFSRLDNPLSIQVGGTGLGLYWAKRIIDLHNGTIEIESAKGLGSTFTVKLPIER